MFSLLVAFSAVARHWSIPPPMPTGGIPEIPGSKPAPAPPAPGPSPGPPAPGPRPPAPDPEPAPTKPVWRVAWQLSQSIWFSEEHHTRIPGGGLDSLVEYDPDLQGKEVVVLEGVRIDSAGTQLNSVRGKDLVHLNEQQLMGLAIRSWEGVDATAVALDADNQTLVVTIAADDDIGNENDIADGDVVVLPTHIIREIELSGNKFHLVERNHIMAVVRAE